MAASTSVTLATPLSTKWGNDPDRPLALSTSLRTLSLKSAQMQWNAPALYP